MVQHHPSVPPAVRPGSRLPRPLSRHPPEFLTASLLPPPSNESRAPPPCPQTPYPQKAGRPCRFGAGASETTPAAFLASAVIGRGGLVPNTLPTGPTRQSRLEDTHTHDVAELRDRTVAGELAGCGDSGPRQLEAGTQVLGNPF
ncbi:hypothetical protein CMUS01_13488 [Colletotrichum musicola]|uniref:Uncharacterized protein n=1 Tax=Colletotrichum musicola TaxID=2175873 RepID=A0A8H6JC72_9PEZI|nr:hypothetical protein CMUS01_13488 [Colletotrichum musicola]